MSGDFDHDGRTDVVAVGFSTADVHFLTTEGNIDQTITLPNDIGIPGVGDVDGDERDDIVLALDHAVGVLLGQDGRSFTPANYATMFVAPNTRELVPLGAYTTDGVMLSFSENMGNTSITFVTLNQYGGHDQKPAGPPAIPGTLEGAVAAKGVNVGGVRCGVTAFELSSNSGQPGLLVTGVRCGDNVEVKTYPLIGGEPWGGVYFADVDLDGTTDLFFGIDTGIPTLNVIRTDLNGQDLPPETFLNFQAGNCSSTLPTLASAPLAIGDVNGDAYPDFVDSRGVLLYNPNNIKPFVRACHSYSYIDPTDLEKTPVSWTNAVIGDFNGDGQKDILASRKGEGVLDLWTWRPGGFSTIPIFVGDPVAELVTGDFDGDTVADAAFRLSPPGNMMGMGPSPIFAMFGNPLALPSPPQPLGFLENVQRIAAGRIKGVNAIGEPDVLSDLVVISSGMPDPMNPMATPPTGLTLFQGNATRNLVAALSLQKDTTSPLPVESTDQVYGLFISDLASQACKRFEAPLDPPTGLPPWSNVVALGDSGRIWLAGCDANGSSRAVQENLNLKDVSFLFAPVDRESLTNTGLAVFMSNPPVGNGPSMGRSLGMDTIEYNNDSNAFTSLDGTMPAIDSTILLPSATNLDVPFAIADVDDNGLRDVIVTGKNGDERTIYIFWNGDDQNVSGAISVDAVTRFTFTPGAIASVESNGPPITADSLDIKDIVALNVDGDRYRELAILTKDNVFLAKLELEEVTNRRDTEPMLQSGRPLKLMLDNQAFANIRGGEALLAIDADSDGIDDLLVADQGKLLLYVGTERLK